MLALFFHSMRGLLLAIAGLASLCCWHPSAIAQPQQLTLRNTIPSQQHFLAINQLYQGEYRDAERLFRIEARGSIKIGVTRRWIDAICYHAMWGEVFYHQGRPEEALDQFNQACAMFLQYPKWMLRVEFKQPPRVDTNRIRFPIPWGVSARQFTLGRFSDQMLIGQGDLYSTNRAIRQGGVVNQLHYKQVNVIEIIRCTALAIRRRNELLGPLGPHDTISRELVSALSSGAAPPNHWSGAWADLQLGLAQLGVGDIAQAEKRLQRAERVAGKFDHPLTCVALLELGRIAMEAGKTDAAARLFAEASYSAFYYEDAGIVDEAFRLGTNNRAAAATWSANPALDGAAAWSRKERYRHILGRLLLAHAEEQMARGDWNRAAASLKTAYSRMKDARTGLLGAQAQYLDARIQFRQQRDSAEATLQSAIAAHIGMSTHNLRLQLANTRFDQQQLRPRTADKVYAALLGDPAPSSWVFYPLETLAALKTPDDAAFDRWLAALVSRNDWAKALEVTDLAKRRRFLRALAWGGRRAALRDTLELPDDQLGAEIRNGRDQLLLRFPEYATARKEGQQLQTTLQSRWQPGLDNEALGELVPVWRDWAKNLRHREAMIAEIGLQRVPADSQFPPLIATAELQSRLQPGEAVAVFHDTPGGLLGFLVTAQGSTQWNCGPMSNLARPLRDFLRALGNYDANHQSTVEELASEDWMEAGAKFAAALFEGSSLDPRSLTELVVVPDGLVWYVPLAALPVKIDEGLVPLITTSRVRVAPTVGLAFAQQRLWRRVQRTGLVGDDIVPGSTDEEQAESLASFRQALTNPIDLPDPSPAPPPMLAALTEALVVLDNVELDLARPLDWSPIPRGRNAKQNTLGYWLNLPQFGPQRIVLPATHTVAENGGKVSKRRASVYPPGTELFLATCSLMSTGAQTILLSNWQVGGLSTMEIVGEFVQELPHTTAADAWQRSVQLARELPLEPATERRVKAGKSDLQLTARHPFFWGGYLLIDTGAPIADESETPAVAQRSISPSN